MTMDERNRELVRSLAGELSEEAGRDLDARLATDPSAALRREALRSVWEGLEEPPERGVPPGFTTAVMAKVRAEAATEPSFSALPGWARLLGAGALASGIAIGAVVGTLSAPGSSPAPTSNPVAGEESADLWSDPGPGESYWLVAERGTSLDSAELSSDLEGTSR